MTTTQLIGGPAVSFGSSAKNDGLHFSLRNPTPFRQSSRLWRRNFDVGSCSLSSCGTKWMLPYPVIYRSKRVFSRFRCHLSSDSGVRYHDVENSSPVEESSFSNSNGGWHNISNGASPSQIREGSTTLSEKWTDASQETGVKRELLMLSLPAVGGQAIEPMAQLLETGYIGNLGSVELASAGVSISLFNIISKLFNIPLLSVTTSFVAEDISKNVGQLSTSDTVLEKQQLSPVTAALMLASCIGIFEAMALSLGSRPLLGLMGISQASPMFAPAQKFLILRAVGAPAFVLSLAIQGIFRGFKDMKTPVICLGMGNITAIFLFPLFMGYLQLGVNGAAIATVTSQYIVTFLMIWNLHKRVALSFPNLRELKFDNYLKSGGFLIGRTLAVLLTMTLATSMAARQGTVAMAAHQICLQVWLSVSLITDALAASAQALIATYVSQDDYRTVREVSQFVIKIGLLTGVSLALVLGLSFSFIAPFFTKDAEVLEIVRNGVFFVSASQPITSLAFVFDGLHYGVSDFHYAAFSMMLIGTLTSVFLLYAPKYFGLRGVWSGLTLLMTLRVVAGFIRILDPRGPWWFLHGDIKKAKGLASIT